MDKCKLGVISQERLKTGVKLLWSVNRIRKSYMPRRSAQQLMSLSDLRWPFRIARYLCGSWASCFTFDGSGWIGQRKWTRGYLWMYNFVTMSLGLLRHRLQIIHRPSAEGLLSDYISLLAATNCFAGDQESVSGLEKTTYQCGISCLMYMYVV